MLILCDWEWREKLNDCAWNAKNWRKNVCLSTGLFSIAEEGFDIVFMGIWLRNSTSELLEEKFLRKMHWESLNFT